MAQYEKLINLGLLNQFLTKAKTIFAPKITASGILKGDGNGGVSAATAGTDYATPAQSLALCLTGASVGDLVRVNAVDANGMPTSWRHVPLNEIKCNKNLLDNWYFVGGGSQLGDGVFPINQRGQTTYSGAGYGIDRWTLVQGEGQITVENNCITLSSATNDERYFQFFDNYQKLVGKQVTLSALTSDGLKYSTFVYAGSGSEGKISYSGYEVGLSSWYGKKGAIIRINKASKQVSIIAVKLELGSEQTLAHNEGTEANPVWVLNEIPDYGEELAKCQRYLVCAPKRSQRGWCLLRPSKVDSYRLFFFLPLEVEMAADPPLSTFQSITAPSLNLSTYSGWESLTDFSINDVFRCIGGLTIIYEKQNHGLDDASLQLYNDTIISCEP